VIAFTRCSQDVGLGTLVRAVGPTNFDQGLGYPSALLAFGALAFGVFLGERRSLSLI